MGTDLDFAAATGANDGGVVRIRRDLHRFPEMGFLEYRTAAKAAAALERLGWSVKAGPEVMVESEMPGRPSPTETAAAREAALAAGAPLDWVARMPGGQTGVVAEMRRGEGPVLAFRFDMDALPVRETEAPEHAPNREGFRSTRPGVMHACGHDGHTAIGLALAARLAAPTARWQGTIRLIFQPAEEGGRGARPMVAAGAVDGVDHFFAGHLGCLLPSGTVAPVATGFLYSNKLDAFLEGRAAHAAMGPQEGRNALLAGAMAALNLHAISRHAEAPTLVNVGKMVAGSGRNVIADSCHLVLEVRGGSQEALDYMDQRAREVLAGAAAMQDVALRIKEMGGSIGATPSPEAAAIVAEVARTVPGITRIEPEWPIGGGDDATLMLRQVQEQGGSATYFLLGADLKGIHHAVDFDFDEAALPQGVDLFAGIAERVLGSDWPCHREGSAVP